MELKDLAIQKLKERGVELDDICDLSYDLQLKHNPTITKELCKEELCNLLSKREVVYAVLTGIAIDKACEEDVFDKEIGKIINDDDPLFGVDEILALSIVNVEGAIAYTNFGYLDKIKSGIIGKIDVEGKDTDKCTTFLDDIIGALASATASRIAHRHNPK